MSVKIVKDKADKCPCEDSLFISFDYNPNLIEIIKSMPIRSYDSQTKKWEIPFEHKNLFKRKVMQ